MTEMFGRKIKMYTEKFADAKHHFRKIPSAAYHNLDIISAAFRPCMIAVIDVDVHF
jgi:hypothetical protein